jgi:hypothetical protein
VFLAKPFAGKIRDFVTQYVVVEGPSSVCASGVHKYRINF